MSYKAPITEAAIEKYGNQREQMYEYVASAANRNYPIEVNRWEKGSFIGIEVILTDDRLGHYGTLQDIARGAVEDWFLRDVEPIDENRVRFEFSIDTEVEVE
jgi:hypothetical protein